MKTYHLFPLIALISLSFTGSAQNNSEKDRILIRVLSYNILHGATTNRDNNLDVVAKVISNTHPDIVALQEMDYKTNRANKLDVTVELAMKTNMVSIFGKAIDWDGGEYGQSLLSKYTFLKTEKHELPTHKGNEIRIAVESLIILPAGDTIRFVGTHLDQQKNGKERHEQVARLNQLFLNDNIPSILAGDLNDIPDSETLRILEAHWSSTSNIEAPMPTFPSHAPEKKIDYIMFYPEKRWKVVETKVLCDNVASDHCAVLAVLELLPKKKQ